MDGSEKQCVHGLFRALRSPRPGNTSLAYIAKPRSSFDLYTRHQEKVLFGSKIQGPR